MADIRWEEGFLQPLEGLTSGQVEEACEMAIANARDLLDEADLLRANDRCARAYFLAQIACEELGKLPILLNAAVSVRMGYGVDWRRIDRLLRSHEGKIKRVLFMDSIVGKEGLREGKEGYEEDLRRLRTYTDFKNASLYSFHVDGRFYSPQASIPCEFANGLLKLARSRFDSFEAMYLKPIRDVGGLDEVFSDERKALLDPVMQRLTGPEAEKALEAYEETGDESKIRKFIEKVFEEAVQRGGADST